MSESKHTPTRHGTTVYPGGRSIDILSEHPEWTAYGVRACKGHDALVEALRVALERIEQMEQWHSTLHHEECVESPGTYDAKERARAALALAEEG